MTISTVFINNRTQAVRLPIDLRLPDGMRKVKVRAKGNERIISPVGQTWDSFFLSDPAVSDDFMPERASQHQAKRQYRDAALPA
ncbi:AbrB/MazE/SpoVT family DNA-binding domain-containing protein [Acidovorax carolinensis]|uniref:AbrB/MazE/SpoVT family DNA-binding domain-containing protein n=1 Tax=Acidovorax carolinensis TaxID=553814 RepID=A0A240U7A9_9BURK|nr:type II toxin-antitoxin system VapB family antitoxin [Acidovorax carolinensis]ART53273.1 AbrB/MazE/SpoVT family DNA-binding domain-containing protein [Acidovorax carolinensis]